MIAKTLSAFSYRNLENINLDFSDKVNIICGENAQGKTNLLEAIWYFSAGKSFRASKEREVIMHGANCAKISLDFLNGDRVNNLSISIKDKGKKCITLNSVPIKKTIDVLGNFTGVLFSPDHLVLIKEGALSRRKFLDFGISQITPKYSMILARYNKILAQRNAALKQSYYNKSYRDTLDVWDYKLATYAAYIVYKRVNYIKKLDVFAKKNHFEISQNKEELSLSYLWNGNFIPNSQEEIYNFYMSKFKEQRSNEIREGNTLFGPHRDDLNVMINDFSARYFASQGQQRSCVLSLKIAEAEMINEEYGEYPVLLFDDVLSELDDIRQDFILSKIDKKQVIITCCLADKFATLTDAKIFNIKNGGLI
ncbi:MAG: DNA replication/repair protein RecF [Clostridia bacterium]